MAFKNIVILFFFHTIFQSQLHNSIAAETWIKAGYYQANDITYSPNIQSINSTLYTHLIYGFANIDFNTSTDQMIVSISDDEQLKNFNTIVKKKNPSLKTLLSIGGKDQSSYDSGIYLLMSSTYFPGRKFFIESSIKIARLYGFDGLDFCWISPSSSQEMTNLGTLLDDWRIAIDFESKNSKKSKLLLTMAVQYTPWIQDLSFPIESMRKYLDWVHVFAFDYYDPASTNNTSPVAALYDSRTDLNTDYGINAWIKSGFPTQKLVLGLPFYGYVWTLVSPKDNKIGATGTGPGPKDYSFGAEAENEPFSSISSWLRFNDIKRGMIKYRANNASYNATYVMNYVSVGTSWVGFDDVEAVKTKVAYAKEKHLRGYFAWEVSYDWNSVLSQAAAGEVEDIQEGVIDQSGMHKKKKLNRVILILIPVGAVLILLLLVFTLWCLRKRRLFKFQGRIPRNKIGSKNEDRRGGESSSLHVFTFDEMKSATNNFSVDNELGRGGYGPVYKGKLRNGQEIAVKRLSETSTQGLEEFENEVILTAKLQHINLVKVVGFCIERKEKMLIYEYMPNKSLDYYIYNQVRRLLLNWEKRVQVIEGIIQGLLYLQEYSRLTIIHRDLKASNILLDIDMKPKISDFGMARIFKKDEVEANTLRVVGTMGYIPPEYVEQGIYSTKSDVFSFGVLLLQIISGRKNTCLHGPDENLSLLEYAYEMWRDGKGMEFMDPSLDDTTSSCKLLKCMQISLLCVQKNPLDRPTMLEVSYLLKDVNFAMNSLKRPAFSTREDEEVGNSNGSVQEIGDVDTATITQLVAR
ncbi:PREDICTED: putative cysteine-rich receptor-like protein kinase 20 isoform X1 [Nicotiana attenuata]|uniref:non-specific serine/threonine protein kinase n=1 Tax=Nicotiana attenuata TaxID=49451 RepID=A0A314KXX7_NICAT|nr:PREDICTED: putative cysteine-rich receptor-like protein kinase 20 isoform X1 [Nicotiana attenuata]OIT33639.1 g-type lectin s-receptor-like serinethreonine-protein kinase [Nicotiana attenuata]